MTDKIFFKSLEETDNTDSLVESLEDIRKDLDKIKASIAQAKIELLHSNSAETNRKSLLEIHDLVKRTIKKLNKAREIGTNKLKYH